MYYAFNNWGVALSYFAKVNRKNAALYKSSYEKYEKSIEINPNKTDAFFNWGITLCEQADQEKDKKLFLNSFEKFYAANKISPKIYEPLNSWGNALLLTYSLTKNDQYLTTAKEILERSEKINGDDIYNLACLYAILNEPENCKVKLFHCKAKNTLPDKQHLSEDKDLENVRNLD